MLLNEIKHLATEHIWLVPMYEDGQLGYVWCDDPAPGMDMQSEDAVEYVRADTLNRRDLIKQAEGIALLIEKLPNGLRPNSTQAGVNEVRSIATKLLADLHQQAKNL